MKVEVVREIEFSELEKMIRRVPLNKEANSGKEIFVYENANIELRKNISPIEVNPTTFYVLRSGIKRQEFLHSELLKQGYDTFNLDKALVIKNEKEEEWTLTPPIIEVTTRRVKYVPMLGELKIERDAYIQVPIINDGAHRVYTAMQNKSKFTGIWISGADPKYPFYAHPNEWAGVSIVDQTPKEKSEKKFYSRENCYGLYRDFSEIGCGAPRGVGK